MLLVLSSMACVNNAAIIPGCPDEKTVRQVKDKSAIIQKTGTQFYIVEQNTIATKLKPCNLPTEFRVDHLAVIVSGDVKSTIQNAIEPCRTNNFMITNKKMTIIKMTSKKTNYE